jgi:membrane fusion protein, multidrug efflux system
MNQKFKIVLMLTFIVIIIIVILFLNRSRKASELKEDKYTSYPVEVFQVKYATLNDNLQLTGTTEAIDDLVLLSETQGKVLNVKVDVGSKVCKDMILAHVDDELIRAAFISADANFLKVKKDNERFENLYKVKNLSETELENSRLNVKNAEAQYIIAKKQLENTKVTSPVNGIITKKFITEGSTLSLGMPVFNIVNISRLTVKVNIPEQNLFSIRTGDKVAIRSDVLPSNNFTGNIQSVNVKGDAAHTFPVEIEVDNQKNLLRAGMFVNVDFSSTEDKKALIIPRNAVVGSLKEPKVYVVENKIARLKPISIFKEKDNLVQVMNGLKEGDKVILNGQNNLNDNAEVTINNKK